MPPNEQLVREDLRALKPSAFVARWFAERVPYLFADNQLNHIAWKQLLADYLGVCLFDLTIVGSAAVGNSLNPSKNFAPFGDDSDIDVAVISSYHFDVSWRWMRRLGSDRYRLPQPAQEWVKEHESRLVYWGSIATDQLLPYMPFGPEWVPKLAKLAAGSPVNGRDINVRLYRDHASLEAYLIESVRKCRAFLDSTPDETPNE